jgi:hypothetical protein
MGSLLTIIDGYSGLIAAVSTLTIAILTIFLWFENRRLRKAGSAPDIVAYLAPHPDGTGAIEFVLANVGKGPAFHVSFQLSYDEADFEAHRVYLVNDKDRTPISVLPQDDKIKSLFGISFELYGKVDDKDIGQLKPFDVDIEFVDEIGRKKKSRRTIDIRQFAGLRGILQKSSTSQVVRSLEKIEDHLSKIARQSSRFSAFVDVTEIQDQYVKKTKGDQ